MKKIRSLIGVVLALAVALTAIPTVPAKASTRGMTEEQKWQELQRILPAVTGRYTEAPEKDSVSGNLFTAGMLLGNGSLGVVSDARHGEQSFYISTADGYARTTENRKITNAQLAITGEMSENQLEVTVNDRSTNTSDKDQGPAAVIDNDPLSYWVSNPTSRVSGPKWLVFTFARPVTIDAWTSIHRGYMDTGAGYHNPRYNTLDFCLQISEDGSTWETVDDIVGNSDYIVERKLAEPVTSRFYRIYITKPVQPGQETATVTGDRETARISEVDFFSEGKSVIHTEEVVEQTFSYSQSDSAGFNGSTAGAFDGDPYTYWRSNNQLQTGVDKPKTIAVTSNQSFTFNELEILHFGSRYPDEPQYNTYDFEVQVQQDGAWNTLKTVAGNVDNTSRFTFEEPVTATGLRLYITKPVHPDYATKYLENDMTYAVIYDINILQDGKNVIHPETEDDTYLHEQDIMNAEVRSKQMISGEQFYFTSWVERDKNILVTEVKLDEHASGDARLFLNLTAPETSGTSTQMGAADDLLYVTRAGAPTGNESAYRFRVATALKVLSDKYTVNGGTGELILSPGETVRMITYSHTSAGTTQNGLSYKEANVLLTEAQEYLGNDGNFTETAIAQARQESRSWWKEYWLQSYIDIGDEVLQRYYYGALYGLGSTIRPTPEGAQQPNLPSAMYGVWQTNDSPGSGGRAYLNYNYEAPYYGLHSSNRSYLMEPYYEDVSKRLSYIQEKTAQNGYNGASIVRNILPVYPVFDLRTDRTTVAGTKKPTGSGFADQKTNTMLYTQALLWDWQYNRDQERLVQYIYNTVRDAVIFYIDFVVYNEKDGKYWIYNSASNERDGYDYDTNPTIDIGYIQSHFNSFIDIIEEADELGVTGIDTLKDDKENLIPKMQNILDNLVEYPTNINNQETADDLASKGFAYDLEIIMSALSSNNGTQVKAGNVPWGMYIYEGNQPVPLEGLIHPAENVSLASDSNMLALVSDTFDYFNPLYPYYRGGGYNGFAKSYTMAARLGMDGDKLANHLASTIGAIIRNNNTCMTSGHGIEVFGNVEAINSMLLQNENDELRVFPAWAKSKDAKFVDLRAKGAFLVSSEYKAGSGVDYVTIHSEMGNQVSFVAPWDGGVKVVDSKGNTVPATRTLTENTAEFMYMFDTKAGETYTVTKEGELPANTVKEVTLSIDSQILKMGESVQTSYEILPADDTLKAVKFESSNTEVATVNNNGVICGRGAGTATITLSSVQDPSIQASVQIKVIKLEAPQNGITKYNNDAAGTSTTGAWTHHKSRPGAYNNDSHWSRTTGNSFEFTFNGTGVDFYSEKFNNCGKYEVWMDGIYIATYDNYLDIAAAQRDILSCSVKDLEYGQHTLKLVVAENKYLHVDAFVVYAEMGLEELYEELSMITEVKQSDYSSEAWENYLSVWEEAKDTYDKMLATGNVTDQVDALVAKLKTARNQSEQKEYAALVYHPEMAKAEAGNTRTRSYTMAYSFRVKTPISVTELGIYDQNGDGIFSHAGSQAAIWKIDGSEPVAIAEIAQGTAADENGYCYTRLKQAVNLEPGEYEIAVYYPIGSVDNWFHSKEARPFTVASQIEYLVPGYTSSEAELTKPVLDASLNRYPYHCVNFKFQDGGSETGITANVEAPMAYQIFQRDVDGTGTISVNGNISEYQQIEVEITLWDKDGKEQEDYEPVQAEVVNGSFQAKLEKVPTGLFQIQVTGRKEGKQVFQKVINPVGVGDLWIIAGQSNAAGFGKYVSGEEVQSAKDDPSMEGVHLYDWSDGTWSLAAQPIGSQKTDQNHAPGLTFAKEISKAAQVPVGIIQVAVGGSNIRSWIKGGEYYKRILSCVDPEHPQVKGMFWYQGESETFYLNDGTQPEDNVNAYAERYTQMVNDLREDLQSPNMVVITAQLNTQLDRGAKHPPASLWYQMKEIQRQLADPKSDIYVPGTAVIATSGFKLSDSIHNSANSNVILAKRMAKAALALAYGADVEWGQPNLRQAEYRGNTVCLTFENAEDGLKANDAINDFTVRDESGDVPITKAEIKGNQVILTVERDFTGTVKVDGLASIKLTPTVYNQKDEPILAFYDVTAVPVSEESDAAIAFLGGSLRMDYTDYAKTSLRFGYRIELPQGAELQSWYWDYSVNGQPELTSRLAGHNMIIHEDGSITSNLVITGIPSKYYDRDLYAQLTITYTLNGKMVTVTESIVQKRSVAEVANAILADETATAKEHAYAQGIVDILKNR